MGVAPVVAMADRAAAVALAADLASRNPAADKNRPRHRRATWPLPLPDAARQRRQAVPRVKEHGMPSANGLLASPFTKRSSTLDLSCSTRVASRYSSSATSPAPADGRIMPILTDTRAQGSSPFATWGVYHLAIGTEHLLTGHAVGPATRAPVQ